MKNTTRLFTVEAAIVIAHGYCHARWLTAGYVKPRNRAYSDTRNFHTDLISFQIIGICFIFNCCTGPGLDYDLQRSLLLAC